MPKTQLPTLWHPDRFTALLAFLGVLGTSLILLRLYHGVGVNGDAKYYIEVARALAEGERGLEWVLGRIQYLLWEDYTVWGTDPFVFDHGDSAKWPPLYSVLLAAFGGFIFDARNVAGPLNAVAFGLTIFVAGLWLRSVVRSRIIVLLGCAAILFSVTAAWIASWAYSEIVFMLLTTLALFYSSRSLSSPNGSSLIWAATFTALACLTRYTGIVLILTIVPILALHYRPVYLPKLKRIGLYLMISATPLALWLIHNYLITETLTGPTRGLERSVPLVTQIGRVLSSIEAWNPLMVDLRSLVLPLDLLTGRVIGALVAGVLMLVIAIFVLWAILQWLRDTRVDQRITCLLVAGVYAFSHIGFIIVNAALGNVILQARHVVPAYIPLVLVIVIGADIMLNRRERLRILPVGLGWKGLGGKMSPPTLFVGILVACVGYASFISLRDTHTAVFNPEYGWNAYVYNAEHITIDTTSLNDYLHDRVAGSAPIAQEHFDIYLEEGTLFYFRENCSEEDFARKISLRVVPSSPLHLSGIRKNFGMDILSFYPDRQGTRQNGNCLAIAPLPAYEFESIATGQLSEEEAFLWEVSISR